MFCHRTAHSKSICDWQKPTATPARASAPTSSTTPSWVPLAPAPKTTKSWSGWGHSAPLTPSVTTAILPPLPHPPPSVTIHSTSSSARKVRQPYTASSPSQTSPTSAATSSISTAILRRTRVSLRIIMCRVSRRERKYLRGATRSCRRALTRSRWAKRRHRN